MEFQSSLLWNQIKADCKRLSNREMQHKNRSVIQIKNLKTQNVNYIEKYQNLYWHRC